MLLREHNNCCDTLAPDLGYEGDEVGSNPTERIKFVILYNDIGNVSQSEIMGSD